MEKQFCDRCGAEIKPLNKNLFQKIVEVVGMEPYEVSYSIKKWDERAGIFTSLDLCPECYNSLLKWLGIKGDK